jgi:hypothetical protein
MLKANDTGDWSKQAAIAVPWHPSVDCLQTIVPTGICGLLVTTSESTAMGHRNLLHKQ